MTDAELLQFAYLALGKTGTAQVLPIRGFMMEETGREMLAIPVGEDGGWWNSLLHDKHCAELEAHLRMHIRFYYGSVEAQYFNDGGFLNPWDLRNHCASILFGNDDPQTIRRRAVTMVAANVGKQIHDQTTKK